MPKISGINCRNCKKDVFEDGLGILRHTAGGFILCDERAEDGEDSVHWHYAEL